MSSAQLFTGVTKNGEPVTAAYLEQRAHNIACALVIPENGLPKIAYWGKALSHPDTIIHMIDAMKPQRVTGTLDNTSWPSILPTQAEAWTGEPRLNVSREGVELFCKFAVTDIQTSGNSTQFVDSETTGLGGARLLVVAKDAEQQIELQWVCEMDESGVIRQQATLRNLSDSPLAVGKVELAFPLPADATELVSTTGRHLRERSMQRQVFTIGRFEKLSVVGRPDFDASLVFAAGKPGFGFEQGDVYCVHLGWSGNSLLSAERLPYTQGLLGGAEKVFSGEIVLSNTSEHTGGTDYETPWLYGSFGCGLNEAAQRFHEFLRLRHPNIAKKPRPVILNTWEAVYFEHDFETLRNLAEKAAETGVERFVVDDGWFGSRRDDTSGLGDWTISQEVWPDGPHSLKALADTVHGFNMEFGLWFEPEMVNPDSDMARNHPEWILSPTQHRLPMQGRSQQVVDLTNPAAYDYVYQSLHELINKLGIDYIKWDHNRFVTEPISRLSGRPAVHRQTLALYRLMRDLKQEFSGLEIESCASGGGRVDLGILEIADRIWASDCVDPVERADIQRNTSLLVPPEMIGEHIGASPAHSTLRETSLQMRTATAFFGHLGIEWNLLKQPERDLHTLQAWVHQYKKYRQDFATGCAVHADSSDPSIRVDGVVSKDRSRAVYRFTQLTTSQSYPATLIHLPGLDPQALYRVAPFTLNLELENLGLGFANAAPQWWDEQGVELSGQELITFGIRPPALHPAQAVLFTVERVSMHERGRVQQC